MKIWKCFLPLILGVGAVIFAQTAPTDNGTYVKNGDNWVKLYLASSDGMRSTGAAKMAFSYGIAHAKSVFTYRDPSAAVKTTLTKPEFEIVGADMNVAPHDIVIVRLKQKKDHRELQVGNISMYSGTKFEYPPEDVTEVDVTDKGDVRFIVPKTDLKTGEYMLFVSATAPMPTGFGGFDFSVTGH